MVIIVLVQMITIGFVIKALKKSGHLNNTLLSQYRL